MTYSEQNKLKFPNLTLTVFEETFTIHKFAPSESVPQAVRDFDIYSVSKHRKGCLWFVQDTFQFRVKKTAPIGNA